MINIQTYFNPISSNLFSAKNNWEATQIGRLIDSHVNDSFPDLKFSEIAFLTLTSLMDQRIMRQIQNVLFEIFFIHIITISFQGSLI